MEVDDNAEYPLRAMHGFGSVQDGSGRCVWNMYGLFSFYDRNGRFDPDDPAYFRWLPVREYASVNMVMDFLIDNHEVQIPTGVRFN